MKTPLKGFQSYFLSFKGGAGIELMKKSEIQETPNPRGSKYGYAHIAISVGSKEKVMLMTEEFRMQGPPIIGDPRTLPVIVISSL